ncbi:MAG: helix-turn-helix domain-containing protein [Fibromonadaceae bacterium]|nr:helix-turn-helix domain-containing protein [Fibromonadaceae bacterium]
MAEVKKKSFLGLKKFRERIELRQNQLAEKLGATSAAYNNWEKGKNELSHNIYKKLFELGATVEELFGIEYNKRNNLVSGEPPVQGPDDRLARLEARVEGLELKNQFRRASEANLEPPVAAGVG